MALGVLGGGIAISMIWVYGLGCFIERLTDKYRIDPLAAVVIYFFITGVVLAIIGI